MALLKCDVKNKYCSLYCDVGHLTDTTYINDGKLSLSYRYRLTRNNNIYLSRNKYLKNIETSSVDLEQ